MVNHEEIFQDETSLSGFGNLIAAVRSSMCTTKPRVPCRNFAGEFVPRLPCAHRHPMVWVFLSVTSTSATRDSILATRPLVMAIQVAPLSSLPPSVAIAQPNFSRKDVTAPSTRFHVLIAFSSIFLWQNCVTYTAMPTLLGPLATDPSPVTSFLCDS